MTLSYEDRGDTVVLCAETPRLNQQTTRRLAIDPATVAGRKVRLDLGRIRFVEPFGLVYLYWLVRVLRRECLEVEVAIADFAVQNYLTRMNLPRAFEDDEGVRFRPNLKARLLYRRNLSKRLVELRVLTVDNDDEVEEAASELMGVILDQRPDLREPLGYQLHYTIVELLSNTEVHSRSNEAAVAVQTYRDRVYMALGDSGIGIPRALECQRGTRTDAETIELALERGVTSRPGSFGGLGLTDISNMVRKKGRLLAIRSGGGHLVVWPKRSSCDDGCAALPGTIVEAVW